jgi:hypothetical protein
MQLVIDPMALNEIAEAAKWYSDKSSTAVENFQREISETFIYLQSTIAEHRKVFADIRVFFLKIFPYNIYGIKKETENKIFILAIMHNKRSSEFIKLRLKK